MAAFLALDRCEVRVDAARADLRICEGQGAFAMGVSFSFPWLSSRDTVSPSTPDRPDGAERA